jgi:hypothetical protein
LRSDINAYKTKQRICFLLLICSLFLFVGTSTGEDWQFISRYKDNFYYDKASITYPVKDYTQILSLWQKIVYEKESAFRIAEELGDKYSDVHESLHLIELHCKRKEIQVRSISYYDSGGRIIDYSHMERSDWKPIPADTPYEELFWMVCPQKAGK